MRLAAMWTWFCRPRCAGPIPHTRMRRWTSDFRRFSELVAGNSPQKLYSNLRSRFAVDALNPCCGTRLGEASKGHEQTYGGGAGARSCSRMLIFINCGRSDRRGGIALAEDVVP